MMAYRVCLLLCSTQSKSCAAARHLTPRACVSQAFRSWADAASAAANRRHVIGRVVKVWSLKAAARAMRSWQEAVYEMAARRRKMGRVVKLMKYRQLARAMVSWRGLVLRRREKVIAGKAAARALRLCTEGCVRDPSEALKKVTARALE